MAAVLLSVLTLLLGLAFLIAGVAKIADPSGFRQALIDFGVPEGAAAPLGFLVPASELSVTAALLFVGTAWWGLVGAITLLSVFSAGIAAALLSGRRPECRCFGQLASGRIGWWTVSRNMAAAVLVGWLAWVGYNGGFSLLSRPAAGQAEWLAPAIAGAATLVGTLGWVLLHLVRQNGRLLLRLEAVEERLANLGAPAETASSLPVGAAAPPFGLPGLNNETVTLGSLLARGQPVLLVFSDPGCGPCNLLMPQVARWQRELSAVLNVAVISRGAVRANLRKAEEFGLTQVLLQKDSEAAERYLSHGTPGAVLVHPDGTVGSALAAGADAIAALVNRTVGGRHRIAPVPHPLSEPRDRPPSPVGFGQRAPQLNLSDLHGRPIELASAAGPPTTLMLFWNPGCGFCTAMLDRLRAWEAGRPAGAPRLIVVSTGAPEDHAVMGLRSPVTIDRDFALGRMFGATGTPSALLLDSEGAVASPVATGEAEVMALASGDTVRFAQLG